MKITTTRPITDFEWLVVKTGYENLTANTWKALNALEREVSMFSDEQLEEVLTLFNAVELHAYQVTGIVNSELDRRT
jgi:uncharacterized alpha-E superfamily protein